MKRNRWLGYGLGLGLGLAAPMGVAFAAPTLVLQVEHGRPNASVAAHLRIVQNAEPVSGFNARWVLPAGITVTSTTAGPLLPAGAFALSQQTAGPSVSVVAYSGAASISGDGVVLDQTLHIAATAAIGLHHLNFAADNADVLINSRHALSNADGSVSLAHAVSGARFLVYSNDSDYDGDGVLDADEITQGRDPLVCAGADLVIPVRSYGNGEQWVCTATGSISTGGNSVVVGAGAEVTYVAPRIALAPGFAVSEGGVFRAGPAAPSAASAQPAAARPAVAAAVQPPILSPPLTARPAPPLASARWWTVSALPTDVGAGLRAMGVDLSTVTELIADGGERWWAFVTPQGIDLRDDNRLPDVYLLERDTGRLFLASRGRDGRAGAGASDYPSLDGVGRTLFFQSQADHLTTDDGNGASDVFAYDLAWKTLSRVSNQDRTDFVGPAAHPATDGPGATVVLDRLGPNGFRRIEEYRWGEVTPTPLSLDLSEAGIPLDNHHPVLSADGRYLAYLETSSDPETGIAACAIQVQDQHTAQRRRLACPDPLVAALAGEGLAPSAFSADGRVLRWQFRGDAPILELPNLWTGAAAGR